MPLRNLLKDINLNLQKLDTMLINDIRLFFRDKKSLILVALTPFLILAILINIFYFSDVSENIRGVKLAVCDRDGRGLDLESEIFETTLFSGDCESEVADLVSSGEYRGAVVIPKGFRQNLIDGVGTELTVYIDNSKQTTAVVTTNAVKAYVSDLNEQIGTAFILEAWKNLKELNENLRFLVENLNKAVPVAKDLKVRLNDINKQMDTIDFEAHQQTVDDVISFLNLMEIQLDYINSSFAKTAPTLPDIPEVNYTPDTAALIAGYESNAKLMKWKYCNETSPLTDPICTTLDYTDSIITSLDAHAANLSSYQSDLNKRIAELNAKSTEIDAALFRLGELASDSSAENQKLKQNIQTLRDNLLFLQDKSENITQSIDELDRSMDKFLTDIIRVTDELNQTITVLDAYTQKDPSTILRPVKADLKPVFKDKLEIFYRLPALMSIILLFIILFISSSLIVTERKGGTMARIFLSPISMFFYVFEKMVYLLLLSGVAILSMVLATLAFQVFLPVDLQVVIVFMIASLLYISMGILIGSFSKSENTSLLTCLVIGFPLMFLSGAFNPPELMDKFMRVASTYLPLTLNISLLERIHIYHTGLDMTKLIIMGCMIIVFYVISVFLIRSKPTLK